MSRPVRRKVKSALSADLFVRKVQLGIQAILMLNASKKEEAASKVNCCPQFGPSVFHLCLIVSKSFRLAMHQTPLVLARKRWLAHQPHTHLRLFRGSAL